MDAAFKAVLRQAKMDDVPDVLHLKDYDLLWPEMRQKLAEDVVSNTYRGLPGKLVEVPKNSIASRPIAVISLRDRVLYEAVLRSLAPVLDNALTDEVFSARLDRRKGFALGKQVSAWRKFEKRGRELCGEYEDVCLLTTDITSYFEFIDIRVLVEAIRRVKGVDPRHVDLLSSFLNGVTASSNNLHGVPQGPEVSSVLGNFYLMPLDHALQKLPVKWIRFQDDIKVFASNTAVLRRAVRDLMPEVRGRHLNLATSKTLIIEGEGVYGHFEDARKDAIQYGIDVGDEAVGSKLEALFDEATTADPLNARDIRFCVYRFAQSKNSYALGWVLQNLDRLAFLGSLFIKYLSDLMEDHPTIEDSVINFLRDSDRNLYPVLEMNLIRMLGRCSALNVQSYDFLWQTLEDRTRELFVREWAARAIGIHIKDDEARTGDGDLLEGVFKRSPDMPSLQRALLVALTEARGIEKSWLGQLSIAMPELRHTCEYLKRGGEIPIP